MARVAVVGGGMVGLSGAMLLARDGHDVTVLERDPAPPVAPEDAWASWERRGVNQFRQGHFFLSRFCTVVDQELPDITDALLAAGALRYNTLDGIPPDVIGGRREGDDRYVVMTGRRAVVESVFANAADATDGCNVRRGCAVTALRTDGSRVDGVVLDSGEVVEADVIVDAGGRRSPFGDLLEQAGLARPVEDRHDFGFVYYTRHFRSADGSVPPALGGLLQPYDSLSIATLPADNGTWAVIVVTSGRDREARALREPDVWHRVVRSYPLISHWVDGEPLEESVQYMGAIEDRYRHFCPDGAPVAPGVVALGDAFACTNPSVGRGVSIGLMHAVALRDLLREQDAADARALSLAWDERTEATVGPWVRDTLFFDGHRLAEIDAQIDGVPYEPDDVAWQRQQLLFGHAGAEPEFLRGVIGIMSLLDRAPDVLARPEVAARIDALAAGPPPAPLPGPSRNDLVALLKAD